MHRVTFFLILFSIALGDCIYAQNQQEVDSLVDVWENKTLSDNVRFTSGNLAVKKWQKINADSAHNLALRILKHAEMLEDLNQQAVAHVTVGEVLTEIVGQEDAGVQHLFKAIELFGQLGMEAKVAQVYYHIGNHYQYSQIFDLALKYFKLGFDTYSKIGDSLGLASGYNNFGNCYGSMQGDSVGLIYYEKGLDITRLMKSPEGMRKYAITLGNVSNVYADAGQYQMAITRIEEANKVWAKLNVPAGPIWNDSRLGKIYIFLNEPEKAIEHLQRVIDYGKLINSLAYQQLGYQYIFKAYALSGDSSKAYQTLFTWRQNQDTLSNKESVARSVDVEAEFWHQKVLEEQAARAKLLKQQQALKAKQEQNIKYALLGGLLLTIAFLFVLFNRFRVIRKQKDTISKQKEKVELQKVLVEEKNTEILDSINYAKRIQSAILPPTKLVKEYLPNSFILYKPKDIVAGDFYWLEHKNGKTLFAAADCTGHGVPGAMVSVICNNGLNRAVREHGLTNPGQILDKTREIVIQEFEKSEDEVKDGMDIALCSLEGNKLLYSGAHNPLWIITKESERHAELIEAVNGSIFRLTQDDPTVVIETKANKQPIGKFDHQTAYTTHTFELQQGDAIYIFSDGFVDQFGGEKGKKFKARAFKELLLSIQEKSMEEQQLLIDNAFEAWRGEMEQVDDVCVIGVKI